MNWHYLLHPGTYIRMRTRRRQALRMMVYSGCLRAGDQYIRYALSEQEMSELLYTKETHETDPQS